MSWEREKCPQTLPCSKARRSTPPKHLFSSPGNSFALVLMASGCSQWRCHLLSVHSVPGPGSSGVLFMDPGSRPPKEEVHSLPQELLTYNTLQACRKVPKNVTQPRPANEPRILTLHCLPPVSFFRRLSGSKGNPPLLLSAEVLLHLTVVGVLPTPAPSYLYAHAHRKCAHPSFRTTELTETTS